MTKKLTILIFLLIGFAWSFSARANTCPRDNGVAIGCNTTAGEYWCAGTCRTLSTSVQPTQAFCAGEMTGQCAPGFDCTGATPLTTRATCGVPESCTTGMTLCNIAGNNSPANWLDSKCKTNFVGTEPNCSGYNTCTEICSSCVGGYGLCTTKPANQRCVANPCAWYQTFNACTGVCTGTLRTLKLGSDSIASETTGVGVTQSGSQATLFLAGPNVSIGTTTTDTKLRLDNLTGIALNMSNGRISGLGEPATGTDAVSLKYLDDNYAPLVGGGASLWATGGTGIYNVDFGSVGIGTANPSTKLDIVGNTGDEYLTIRSLATSSNSGIILKGRNSGIDYQAKIYSNWVGGLVFLPSTGNPIVEFFNNATANTANTIGFRFNALNSVSGAKTYASIIGQTTGITSGSENGAILFNTISTGTLAEKMRIDNIGNVGIGVTNPLGQLHVASNITGTAANFIVEHTQTGVGMQAAYIDAKAENELYFRGFQGAVQKFQFGYNSNMGDVVGIGYGTGNNIIINSLGNIGINTTTPNAKSQIFGGTGVVLNASDGRISGVGDPATSTDAVNLKYLTDNYSPSANSLWATGATGIYNVGLGNVGIGTTTPGAKLHIVNGVIRAGNGDAYNSIVLQDGNGNNAFRGIRTGAYWNDGANSTAFQVGTSGDNIIFTTYTSAVAPRILMHTNSFHINNSYPAATPVGMLDVSVGSTKLFNVLSSGNVGIGTTTPVAKLDVIGNMFSNNLYLSSYRNLGGYGAPIETSSGTKARIIFGAQSSDSAEISSELDASLNTGLVFSIKDDPSDYFDFRNQSNSVLRIMNGGNIGIGTTTLDARLKVVTPTGTGNAINTAGGVITGLGSPSLDTDAVPLKYLNDNFMPAGTTIKSVYIASTVASSTGNNSGHPGYEYANGLCNVASPGSHVCTPDEMLNTISAGLGDRIATSTIGIWIFNGPPGFTANAMDCSGRTVGMVGTGFDDYGTIWVKPTGSGHGYGSLAFCKDSYKFACCK
jgi:hypothetical protein